MSLAVIPMTVKAALRWIDKTHSHLDAPPGGMFAAGVATEGRLCCVALAGVPNARMLNGKALQISRGASDGTTEHAAGMATMALVRAGRALGYARFITYTLLGEPGTVYRATGWRAVSLGEGGEWDRPSRARPKAEQPGMKVRWETGYPPLSRRPSSRSGSTPAGSTTSSATPSGRSRSRRALGATRARCSTGRELRHDAR